jgi:hypothetical protein
MLAGFYGHPFPGFERHGHVAVAVGAKHPGPGRQEGPDGGGGRVAVGIGAHADHCNGLVNRAEKRRDGGCRPVMGHVQDGSGDGLMAVQHELLGCGLRLVSEQDPAGAARHEEDQGVIVRI